MTDAQTQAPTVEERLRARLAALREERARFQREAQRTLDMMSGGIAELEALVAGSEQSGQQ